MATHTANSPVSSSQRLDVQESWRDLTNEEIDAFGRDGAICLRGLYSAQWINALSAELDHLGRLEPPAGTGIKSGVLDWLTRDTIRDFILFGPTAKPVAQALRTVRLNSFGDQTFIKDGLLMEPTPWHHDATFFPLAGSQIASVWTAMDPVTADGSALEFIAGSHLWPNRYKAIGIGGTDHSTRRLEDIPDIEADRSKYDILSWSLEPGDALLFHGYTLHGSRGNATKQRRRAIATRWTGDDITFTGAKNIPWEHGLEAGDPMSGRLFPQVWPGINDMEIEDRQRGPIHPDPVKLRARMKQMETGTSAE